MCMFSGRIDATDTGSVLPRLAGRIRLRELPSLPVVTFELMVVVHYFLVCWSGN